MILINTTYCVDQNRFDDFVKFLIDTYIPLAQASGMRRCLLTRVREAEPQVNALSGQLTSSVAIQMRAPSEDVLAEFREEILPNFYHALGSEFGTSVCFFETALDVIHDPE